MANSKKKAKKKTTKTSKKKSVAAVPKRRPIKKGPVKDGRRSVEFKSLTIPVAAEGRAVVRVYGPRLVVHRFDEKARKQIRDKHLGIAATAKENRIPKREFEDSKYVDAQGRDGVPCSGIKNAIISAARHCDNVTMTHTKQVVYVKTQTVSTCGMDLVLLKYDSCNMREDVVRLQDRNRTPTLRWRAEYLDWSAEFVVTYRLSSVSHEQMMQLLVEAGKCIGLHEGRPEKSTLSWGRFKLDTHAAIIDEEAYDERDDYDYNYDYDSDDEEEAA